LKRSGLSASSSRRTIRSSPTASKLTYRQQSTIDSKLAIRSGFVRQQPHLQHKVIDQPEALGLRALNHKSRMIFTHFQNMQPRATVPSHIDSTGPSIVVTPAELNDKFTPGFSSHHTYTIPFIVVTPELTDGTTPSLSSQSTYRFPASSSRRQDWTTDPFRVSQAKGRLMVSKTSSSQLPNW
jgi:hypothetical protein